MTTIFSNTTSQATSTISLISQIEIKMAPSKHAVALGFNKMIAGHHPAAAILKDLKEMAESNTAFITSLIGKELTLKLLCHD